MVRGERDGSGGSPWLPTTSSREAAPLWPSPLSTFRYLHVGHFDLFLVGCWMFFGLPVCLVWWSLFCAVPRKFWFLVDPLSSSSGSYGWVFSSVQFSECFLLSVFPLFFFPCLVISWQWPPVLHMFDLLSSKESAIFGRFLWREFLLVFDICSIGTNSGFLSEKRRINSGSLYAFSCGVYRFNLFCECKSKGSQCGSHESVCERGIVGV